ATPSALYVVTDLGTLGGADCYVSAVNSSGQAVGYSGTGSNYHAFLYAGGVMQDLGTLGGDAHSFANAINNASQVVGHSGSGRVFFYSAGTMHDIGTLGG